MDAAPSEQLLAGLDFEPLPQGWTPVGAIVLVKCLDEQGSPSWSYRTTDGMNDEELLGALTVRQDILRKKLLSEYLAEEDED